MSPMKLFNIVIFIWLIVDSLVKSAPSDLTCICSHMCEGTKERCRVRPGGKCFTSIHLESGSQRWSFGCIQPGDVGEPAKCKAPPEISRHPHEVECCDDSKRCNDRLDPKVPGLTATTTATATTAAGPDQWQPWTPLLVWFGAFGGLLVVASLLLVLSCCCCDNDKRNEKKERKERKETEETDRIATLTEGGTTRGEEGEEFTAVSSGSGQGPLVLSETTIHRQIVYEQRIGAGRFGEVWKGVFQGRRVAVKKFFTRDEASWRREEELYKTLLVHENILAFVGSDVKDSGSWTQWILVTDYHENGSLHDYLSASRLDLATLMNMALSVSSGLNHLHLDIKGSFKKPPIAHRDLKSKNILVKRDLTCCIADLGLAVSGREGWHQGLVVSQGTKRYMAPEVLDGTLDVSRFESLKRTDIYSMSLVFWEMARRCEAFGAPEEYQPPYYDVVDDDPSIETMESVVCRQGCRPRFDPRWARHPILKSLTDLIAECWRRVPEARLTSLRVVMSLTKMRDRLEQLQARTAVADAMPLVHASTKANPLA